MQGKTLLVIVGPTGVGKTRISIRLARQWAAPIVSADSRQFYRELRIGTAAPTDGELQAARHYFIGTHSIHDEYNSGQFELDVHRLLGELFQAHDLVLLVGGSMMYVDAVCRGIDEMPTISPEVRARVKSLAEECGIEAVVAQLELLDPEYLKIADLRNHKRLLHALEICYQAGRAYIELRTGRAKERPFRIVKVGLNLPREELFSRINSRVDAMIEAGLEQEARSVYPLRHLNSLNTVGYKEMFAYFDGTMDYRTAVERIKKNTRVYAKKQICWYARDPSMTWLEPTADAPRRIIELAGLYTSKLDFKEVKHIEP